MLNSEKVVQFLWNNGHVKIGKFVLKSGATSNIYIDARSIISSMHELEFMAASMCSLIQDCNIEFDRVVGVPYGAIPVATLICSAQNKSLLLVRKEKKEHGLAKRVDGVYSNGESVLVIEDVVTTGSSVLEVVEVLRSEGLVVKNVLCIIDREAGAKSAFGSVGLDLHSLCSLTNIHQYSSRACKVSSPENLHISTNPVGIIWTLERRLHSTKSPFNKKIMKIMLKKHTALCLAIDYKRVEDIENLLKVAAPYICAIKLHIDIIENFDQSFTARLIDMSTNGEFVIIEDRKFADTANTVSMQLKKGMYRISDWADIVTAHPLPGVSMIEALKKAITIGSRFSGCILVAELSCEGALNYSFTSIEAIRKMALDHSEVINGFVCQRRFMDDPTFLYWTPDLQSDGSGQQWRSIEEAIRKDKNDIIIVGRAISDADNLSESLNRYRDASWNALKEREL